MPRSVPLTIGRHQRDLLRVASWPVTAANPDQCDHCQKRTARCLHSQQTSIAATRRTLRLRHGQSLHRWGGREADQSAGKACPCLCSNSSRASWCAESAPRGEPNLRIETTLTHQCAECQRSCARHTVQQDASVFDRPINNTRHTVGSAGWARNNGSGWRLWAPRQEREARSVPRMSFVHNAAAGIRTDSHDATCVQLTGRRRGRYPCCTRLSSRSRRTACHTRCAGHGRPTRVSGTYRAAKLSEKLQCCPDPNCPRTGEDSPPWNLGSCSRVVTIADSRRGEAGAGIPRRVYSGPAGDTWP